MGKKQMTIDLPDEETPKEVRNLASVLENKIEDLIDVTVVGFKKLEKKDNGSQIKDLGSGVAVGLGRVTKAVNEVERSIKSIDFKSEKENYDDLLEPIKSIERLIKDKKDNLPRTPKDPIAVRLSDGDKWIEQLTQIIRQTSGGTGGGSRLQFKKTNGEEVQPTAVDYASNATIKGVVVLNPDGTAIGSAGGGAGETQYAEGATAATATGTVAMGKNGTTVKALLTDSSGNLIVVGSGIFAVQADTELPAAVTPGDNTGVDSPSVLTYPTLFNSGDSKYYRQRGSVNALNSTGTGIAPSSLVAQYDDTSPNSITENQFGNVRMSAKRELYTIIRSGDGGELGATVGVASDSLGAANNSLLTYSLVGLMDGSSNMTRGRTVVNATDTTGTGIAASGILAQYDDTSPGTITENRFGNIRMSVRREVYQQIRDAAGNERGANVTSNNALSTEEFVATSIFNGKTNVTTAGTRVALASSQAVKSVTIKALAANTGTIYVGNSSVASTNGFALAAGDTVSLDVANLSTINIDSSVNGEGVTYIAVN